MKILVVNSGSSSVKVQLLGMPEGRLWAKGLAQRIGEAKGELQLRVDESSEKDARPISDHDDALRSLLRWLAGHSGVPIESSKEIAVVGHRVVHGGGQFRKATLIDEDVMDAIESNSSLAPLHNPHNLLGIKILKELLPAAVHVAVFDTAFHQSIPRRAYLYAIPTSYCDDAGIRRYGFHGISHQYVANRAAGFLGRPLDELSLITCHLGNGASITAIRKGCAVDTSMGFSPLEGLVMGTRSGDLDPSIVLHLIEKHGLTSREIEDLLNRKSGLLGLSGTTNDVRELIERGSEGDRAASLALEVYCYRIKKYVGAYLAVLGGADAIVFTAGVGENSAVVRQEVCEGLESLGIVIDPAKNSQAHPSEIDISKQGGKTRVLVIPTNEEMMIAAETYELAKKG